MAFAYQCAGNAIPSRTAQMDPMRPANVVSSRLPMWQAEELRWAVYNSLGFFRVALCWICWPLIAILLVWLFGRKRFWLTAPNDRCWSTRHKMRKSPYQKHQMQLVAHVVACCMLPSAAAQCWLLQLVAVHLAPVTPPRRASSLVASVNFRLGCHFNPELNDAFAFALSHLLHSQVVVAVAVACSSCAVVL